MSVRPVVISEKKLVFAVMISSLNVTDGKRKGGCTTRMSPTTTVGKV